MARPPLEWPIPVYVVELRDRLLTCFRIPGPALRDHVPGPLTPELRHGQGVVAFCQGAGRCLKSVGGAPTLASEFRYVELLTPVCYQTACRSAVRGNLLLRLGADSLGLTRLVRTALEFSPGWHAGRPGGRSGSAPVAEELQLRRPRRLDTWEGGSLLAGPEEAEALLVHPEQYFVPTRDGKAIHAIPLHQYARRTSAAPAAAQGRERVAAELGLALEHVVPDHVLFQKRCTHTWSFPPERIPAVPAALSAGVGARWVPASAAIRGSGSRSGHRSAR
ncbi:MAG: hypothetical protein FJX77_04255 [Armatimonadetes bacterium]|nr:hypothetical protein [Armatimonadota bacterium]